MMTKAILKNHPQRTEIENLVLTENEKTLNELRSEIEKTYGLRIGIKTVANIRYTKQKEVNQRAIYLQERLKDERAIRTLDLGKELENLILKMNETLKRTEFQEPETPKEVSAFLTAFTNVAKLYSELQGKLPQNSNFFTAIQEKIIEIREKEKPSPDLHEG